MRNLILSAAGSELVLGPVYFPGTNVGEANTAANVGGGTGNVFRDKTGVTLNVKTITGSGIASITDNADTVDINVPAAGSGHLAWTQDEFTASAGQVTFILSGAPADPTSLKLFVNGVLYDDVADFTVSGTTVTWLNAAFVMESDDVVLIRYQ